MLKIRTLTAVAGLAFGAAAQAQVNDDCSGAIAVLNGSITAFDTTLCTNDGPAAPCGAGSNDIWYSITVTSADSVTVSCCGASYDSVIAVYSGACGALTSIACNDDACGLSSTVTASLPAAGTYLIRVMGFGGGVGTGEMSVTLVGPPPPADDLPASAQVPSGTGSLDSVSGTLGPGDAADMFKFDICDFANFSASTVGNTTQDTQLFLFDSAGNAVQMNDDTPAGGGLQSAMGAEFVTANGTYFIAISHYDNDPNNAIPAAIWADTPFNVVRAPDGAHGGDLQPASWDTLNTAAFPYTVTLTGSCYFEEGGCAADFNGDGIVDFFDYLDFVDAFSANDPSSDFNSDGVIDFFDYLDFVDAFSTGC